MTARERTASIVATWFGAGYFPVAPGTFGTLCALPYVWGVSGFGVVGQGAALVVLTLAGMAAAQVTGRVLGVVDAKQIVVDEAVGLSVTMFAVPWSLAAGVAGFALFRLFDITKPWPASYFDRQVKNGAGVVLDDVVAGLFARLVIAGLGALWPTLLR